jgi:hypothetical protein
VRDDPAVISPPIVTQPLYACATAVNVTGYLSGAKLDLEVDGVIVVAGFGAGSPFPNGALLPLPAALVANQRDEESFGRICWPDPPRPFGRATLAAIEGPVASRDRRTTVRTCHAGPP